MLSYSSYSILYYCCYFLLQVRLLHQGEHSAHTLSPRDGSSDSHPLWNFQQNIFRRGNCNSMWPDNRRRLAAMCMYVCAQVRYTSLKMMLYFGNHFRSTTAPDMEYINKVNMKVQPVH